MNQMFQSYEIVSFRTNRLYSDSDFPNLQL